MFKWKIGILFVLSIYSCRPRKLVLIDIGYSKLPCNRVKSDGDPADSSLKAYANKTIVIVSEKFKIDSLKTNSQGQLRLHLRKGNYTLFEAWRYNLETPGNLPITSFDRNCLIREWQKSMYTVRVEKEKTVVLKEYLPLEICEDHFPCLQK